MEIKLYNTMSRKKEAFRPAEDRKVGIYACGPTVYWYQHIGNIRTYIFEDVLKRMFLYSGYDVKHVINVTDVGHLTSDADEGEDKLVKALKREGLPLTEESMLKLADKYFQKFLEDFSRLNIVMPDVWCKATEHVDEMIELVRRIDENGYAYKTKVGLIFDTSKFKDYTKLARLDLEAQEQGARVQKDPERRNASDFALWITNQPNHIMQWESPWGRGFPGWHVECSAMSMKYLGEHFDIHCGGKEHIPVHHTNEIAQAEAATGKKWVNYWLHAEWLVLPEGKMSKSKGSFYTIDDLIEKGYDPLAYRLFCYTAHYRSPLSFTFEALDAAKNAFESLRNRVIELKENPFSRPKENDYKKEFLSALYDDLNMPVVMSVVWAVIKDNDLGNKEKYDLLKDFDKVLGFNIDEFKRASLDEEIENMVAQRQEARKNRDWAAADRIRDQLKEKGIVLEDTKEGVRWRRA